MGIPDGWMDYDRVGKQVHGTRFIAFKVPLKEGINKGSRVPDEKQLYPKLLVSLVPKLGLVIDLTNTKNIIIQTFRDTVNAFLAENADNDKLIGVHCTHGLNRSGFLVCRYMIEEMKIPPLEAIAAFEVARGHKMERENYINKLKCLTVSDGNNTTKTGGASLRIPKKEKLPSLAINTDHDKGCQTNRGFWIDETSVPAHHRTDGHGGYFVHVTKKEIQHRETLHRNDTYDSYDSQRYQQRYSCNRRNRPNSTPQKRSSNLSHSSRPYMQRPRLDYGEHSMDPQSYPLQPRYYGQQLPMGRNNVAEDLLAIQSINGSRNAWQNPCGY